MLKNLADLVKISGLDVAGRICDTNGDIEGVLRKYTKDDFKFKVMDDKLIIKTTSALEKLSLSGQSQVISADLKTIGLELRVICEIIPNL